MSDEKLTARSIREGMSRAIWGYFDHLKPQESLGYPRDRVAGTHRKVLGDDVLQDVWKVVPMDAEFECEHEDEHTVRLQGAISQLELQLGNVTQERDELLANKATMLGTARALLAAEIGPTLDKLTLHDAEIAHLQALTDKPVDVVVRATVAVLLKWEAFFGDFGTNEEDRAKLVAAVQKEVRL